MDEQKQEPGSVRQELSDALQGVRNMANDPGMAPLYAAFRQGAGELGQALKAFPDSVQVDAMGTMMNPTSQQVTQEGMEGQQMQEAPTVSATPQPAEKPDVVYGQGMEKPAVNVAAEQAQEAKAAYGMDSQQPVADATQQAPTQGDPAGVWAKGMSEPAQEQTQTPTPQVDPAGVWGKGMEAPTQDSPSLRR